MRGVKTVIFSVALGAALFSFTACVSFSPDSVYSPEDLWQRTSCAAPLVLRHKTKADITSLDKESRLRAVGLNLYDRIPKGRSLSGAPITYSDSFIKGETCPQKDITTHYVTSIADFDSYVAAKRDVRPIYVRHLKFSDIKRDKSIQCKGNFNIGELERRDKTLTIPVYNEEVCWLILRGANE